MSMPPNARDEARPFVKWAGGKRWLATQSEKITPECWTGHYFEPFVGGGALFFALRPKRATLSDANEELITTYRAIRDNPEEIIRLLRSYPFGKRFFYRMRRKAPRSSHTIAARLLYLNRTCWNGLYRVTQKGQFNTPFGRNENPTICDENRLRAVSGSLQGIHLLAGDFEAHAEKAKPGDFVYFDPPYITGHQNNGFHKYNSHLFSWADQERLGTLAARLSELGVYVLVSNADQESIVRLYPTFQYRQLTRRSLIGGQIKSRGFVTEALFANYHLRI